MLNWPLVYHGAHKGGVSGYTQALALALAERGHRVSTIASGTTYVPAHRPPGWPARRLPAWLRSRARPLREPGPCRPGRHADWFGIGVYEIINSPVLAPSLLQFNDPLGELSCPPLEEAFDRILHAERPDVLHVQSLEGFTLGCLERARSRGCAVVYSLHNYHPLCPQVYLMQGHRLPCTSYAGGRACRGCVPAPDPRLERRRRAEAFPQEPPPFEATPSDRPAPAGRGRTLALPVLPGSIDHPPPVIEPEEDIRGTSALLRSLAQGGHWCTPLDPTWQPLDNTPTAEPTEDGPPTDYARRRRAFLDALNRCQAVHAVSRFVAEKFIAHGLMRERVHTITIGTIAHRIRARHAELAFDPPPRTAPGDRPLRLVFIGVNHWYKGLSMLADSLELLTPELLAQVALAVHAAGGRSIEYRFRRLEPRLASLRYGDAYGPQDLPWMCGGQDAGLVPSVWWDNGPQTVLEMQANGLPIIGARAGGIPDFVRHEVNGLLFRANDRYDLAATIARCVRQPELLARLRRNVVAPKTIEQHAGEIEALYNHAVRS
ncbi:MAG: hypothetical protein KatS3mg103_0870 [Phycisphaerales bacterium]|nr:MAG: hypothetical protein KatS3mg103_0870 [Phycisphaerales bacterium]